MTIPFISLNPNTPASLPLVVCMANSIANKNDIGNGMKAKFKAEPLNDQCLSILKISPQKLATLAEETKERIQGVEKLLED